MAPLDHTFHHALHVMVQSQTQNFKYRNEKCYQIYIASSSTYQRKKLGGKIEET
jgi:hypothetical protein